MGYGDTAGTVWAPAPSSDALAKVLAADEALRRRLDELAGSRRVLHRELLIGLVGWITTEGWAACTAYEQLLRGGTPELLAAMGSAKL